MHSVTKQAPAGFLAVSTPDPPVKFNDPPIAAADRIICYLQLCSAQPHF